MQLATAAAQPLVRPSLAALFCEFLKVALFGFGGGIVLAHRIAVERRRWVSGADFTDALTLCQFMPGPNVVGIAVCVGAKTRGLAGALAAFVGFAVVPGAIGFGLAVVYLGQSRVPVVENVLHGIAPAAAGLMIGTGLRLLRPQRRQPATLLLAALAFAGLAIVKLPLPLILLGLVPLSLAISAVTRPA